MFRVRVPSPGSIGGGKGRVPYTRHSLIQILKPMMLRRLKEDVEKSLAAKEETIIEVQDGGGVCLF